MHVPTLRVAICSISLGVLISAGCGKAQPTIGSGDGGSNPDAAVSDSDGFLDDAGAVDGGFDATVISGPPPSTLPVSFSRPDVGTPLSPAELAVATDELIALLKDTHYFDFVDSRIHGWPESDPSIAHWYGHFWTGITMTKTAGTVTYKHSNDGADNVGIPTSPYLEGACFAHLMWDQPSTAHLVRRMVRGFNGWRLATVKQVGDTNPPLLARTFYPPSVASTDGGRSLFFDYSASRPGIDASPSEYVHLPTNPTFGDIYMKNKRSKDDLGHMMRAIALSGTCAGRLDAAGQADFAQLRSLYAAWASRVDSQGFVIETLDTSGNLWAPPDMLAHYTIAGNLECLGAMAIRLMGGAAPGSLNCGDGLPGIETLGWSLLKNDARQILRSHHAAAVVWAYLQNQPTLALSLLTGLGKRLDLDVGVAESGSPPAGFNLADVGSEVIYAANVGVPLTSREVRWLHARLHEAYLGIRDPAQAATFAVFDVATPDGTYSYDPPNIGLFYRDLGMLIGACASTYRNPAGRPPLDCARLLAAF